MITVDEAATLYTGRDTAHDFDHIRRVLRLAERIARAEGADLGIVRAAALLHDIARQEEAPDDHAEASARRAYNLLVARGVPEGRAQAVAEAIRQHRFRRQNRESPTADAPMSLEAQVLYDADKLDASGAVGVARAYLYGGLRGQRLWSDVPADAAIDPHDPTQLPADHTPVREFVVKLSKLKDTMHTGTGRRIAEGRHAVMVAFFERLGREVRGED
jgi:uncharacterized protein